MLCSPSAPHPGSFARLTPERRGHRCRTHRPGGLIDIEVASGTTLFAVGNEGQVLRSTDLGATWALRTAPSTDDLREQFWIDTQNGYVVGNFLARRTTDGGQSWQPLTGLDENLPMSEVFFTDAQHGIILADFFTWRSTNGGATWTGDFNHPNEFVYPGNTIVLGPQHFLSATNLEGAAIFESTDGGQEWTMRLWAGLGGFLDFDRLADGTLIAVSDEAATYRSTDNGLTWENATYTASDVDRGVIGGIGLGPGGRGAAGTTGSPVPPIHWYRTTDGGANWLPVANAPSIVFTTEIKYWDADRAVAGGEVGRMWFTTDGGATWSSAVLPGAPPNASAFHMSLPSPGVAFAACSGMSQRVVYRTTDFGATWEARSTGIPLAGWIMSVSFLSADLGFACGFASSTPQLFKTTNGGAVWSPVGTAGLAGSPWDTHWFDEQTGLATVRFDPGGIFRTTNAGTSWHNVWSEGADDLEFSDMTHGGALPSAFNSGGVMFVTEDGGATWEKLLLPATRTDQALAAFPDGFLVAGGTSTIVRFQRVDPTAIPGVPSPALERARPHRADDRGRAIAATFTLDTAGRSISRSSTSSAAGWRRSPRESSRRTPPSRAPGTGARRPATPPPAASTSCASRAGRKHGRSRSSSRGKRRQGAVASFTC